MSASAAPSRSRPLVPERLAAVTPAGVTFAEVRVWAYVLRVFTASDLADSMAVNLDIAVRGVIALLYHGIVEGTGDQIDGPYGPEEILEVVPLPPGPREHETGTPEWQAWPCGSEILSPRGMPVRIRGDKEERRNMSVPGARLRIKQSEKRYEDMLAARLQRATKDRERAERDPKWKRKGRGGTVPT